MVVKVRECGRGSSLCDALCALFVYRENIMFQYHQQQEETLTAEQRRSEESVDEKNKKSKACIVM